MEKLLEEHEEKKCKANLEIDTSGCLGDDRECGLCTPPSSQVPRFFTKR